MEKQMRRMCRAKLLDVKFKETQEKEKRNKERIENWLNVKQITKKE